MTPVFLEAEGTVGHSSVRRGDYRYFLRHPEIENPPSDRFGWSDGELRDVTPEDGEDEAP